MPYIILTANTQDTKVIKKLYFLVRVEDMIIAANNPIKAAEKESSCIIEKNPFLMSFIIICEEKLKLFLLAIQ